MFDLPINDIHLAQKADGKIPAIEQVAQALEKAGYVSAGYVEGMKNRENQTSTYLGNGIAIPHGTTDTRDKVLNTGVQVFQFPQGINWGDDQIAYIVIGIAAKSDEHLALLRQLTHILSDESIAQRLAKTESAEELRSLLMGERLTGNFIFDASMVSLDINTNSIAMLQAMNIGHLQQADAIDADFIADAMSQTPLNLGQGIWFSDSSKGNKSSALAVARPQAPFSYEDHNVSILLTLACSDDKANSTLDYLAALLSTQKAERLINAPDAATIVALLTSEVEESDDTLSAEFVLRNEHGLHTRPSSLLVNTIKKFESKITITNLDGTGVPINGRSMMKVVGLGVKKGHRIRFNISGPDAKEALAAIEEAINSGLGEEIA